MDLETCDHVDITTFCFVLAYFGQHSKSSVSWYSLHLILNCSQITYFPNAKNIHKWLFNN